MNKLMKNPLVMLIAGFAIGMLVFQFTGVCPV